MKLKSGLLAVLSTACLGSVLADRMRLKSGGILDGEVVEEKEDAVVFMAEGSKVYIPRSQILSLEKEDGDQSVKKPQRGSPPIQIAPRPSGRHRGDSLVTDKQAAARLTKDQRAWIVATTAGLAAGNKQNIRDLSLRNAGDDARGAAASQRKTIKEWWGIEDREGLLKMLRWLYLEGHRTSFNEVARLLESADADQKKAMFEKLDPEGASSFRVVEKHHRALGQKGIVVWDFVRFLYLCRSGVDAGWISEEEAWGLMAPVARELQSTCSSWREMSENYEIGRAFWSLAQTQKSGHIFREIHSRLLKDPSSPWSVIPWDLDLTIK